MWFEYTYISPAYFTHTCCVWRYCRDFYM